MVLYKLDVFFYLSYPIYSWSNVETRYVCYALQYDSFRNNQFMERLEYHKRDYNEFKYLELRRCRQSTYCIFWIVLLNNYLALVVLGSRNILWWAYMKIFFGFVKDFLNSFISLRVLVFFGFGGFHVTRLYGPGTLWINRKGTSRKSCVGC